MTFNTDIQKTESEIKVLQAKLELLKEIEKHKSQPKMHLENEGKFDLISYNNEIYYRLEYPTAILWYKRKFNTVLELITDLENHRLLEGVWYNDVKYQTDDEDIVLKSNEDIVWKNVALSFGETLADVGPCGYYEMSPDEWLKWAKETYEKLADEWIQMLNSERTKLKLYKDANKITNNTSMTNCFVDGNPPNGCSSWTNWYELFGSKGILQGLKMSSIDTKEFQPTPQTPEEVADGLRDAMRQAKRNGVFDVVDEPYCPDEPPEYDEIEHDISENIENKTIRDVIDRWWMDTFTSKNQWDVDTCIDDLTDQVKFWILRNKND